jgi:N-acetylmuramic acid 6-phosphate etherase
MKAGTAQKLILNMISTATLVLLGKVKGNKMVDMKLSNSKLVDRANRMLVDTLQVSKEEATTLLEKYGNVRNVLNNSKK